MGEVKTNPARIVWGNPLKGVEARDTNRQIRMRDGKPIIQYKMGLAIPKQEFAATIFPVILQETRLVYPQAQWSPDGNHMGVPKDYAWKFIDGDGIGFDDKTGQQFRYSDRAGHAGCYVLACSTEIPVLGYKFQNGAYVQWTDINTGDYVVVPLAIKAHAAQGQAKAGVYVNPQLVEFIGYGERIVSGPDAQQLLGGQQYQLPPGASATPLNAGPGMASPGMMGGPAPGMMPMQQPVMQQPMQQPMQPAPGGMMMQQPVMQQPAPGGMMMAQPQQMQPAYDFVQPGMQQPAPGMMGNGQSVPMTAGPAMNPVGYQQPGAGQPVPGAPAQYGMQPTQPGAGPATYPSNQPMPGQFPNGQQMPGQVAGNMPGVR